MTYIIYMNDKMRCSGQTWYDSQHYNFNDVLLHIIYINDVHYLATECIAQDNCAMIHSLSIVFIVCYVTLPTINS